MNKSNETRKTGKIGEDIACKYLIDLGYKFIDKNFYTRFGEIDLIFKDRDVLVFVEVKTRKSEKLINIENSINKKKVNRILKCAEIYIDTQNVLFNEMRIDAVFILIVKNGWKIKYLKDFF